LNPEACVPGIATCPCVACKEDKAYEYSTTSSIKLRKSASTSLLHTQTSTDGATFLFTGRRRVAVVETEEARLTKALFTSLVFSLPKDMGICGDFVFIQYSKILSNIFPQKSFIMI
jgi:hypothetical protein